MIKLWSYGPSYITDNKKEQYTLYYPEQGAKSEDYGAEADWVDEYNVLVMTLNEFGPGGETGLYKVDVASVRNPASRRGSGPFGRVLHTTKDGKAIAEYRVTVKDLQEDSAQPNDIVPIFIETGLNLVLDSSADQVT